MARTRRLLNRDGPPVLTRREMTASLSKLIAAFLTFIFSFILSIFVVIYIFAVIQPKMEKLDVTSASLAQFNYTSNNNTLHFDLALNITVRNPNRKMDYSYNRVEARVVYQDARLDTYLFEPFKQGPKATNVLSHQFKGQHLVRFNADQTMEFNKEESSGIYTIHLKIFLKMQIKARSLLDINYKLNEKLTCELHVPLKSFGGGGDNGFQVTKCHENTWW